MNLPRVRVTGEISFGAIAQIVTVITMAAAIYAIGLRFQWNTEAGIQRADAAREKYVPIVENLVKSDDTQNFRMESMGTAIIELRKLSIDSTQKLSDIALDVAVIKQQLLNQQNQQKKVQ